MPAPMKTLAVAIAASAAAFAMADTLYKLIDKNGKVTYSEEAPKNFDGKVIRMDIDPNANRAELPRSSRDTGMLKQQLDATAQKDREIDALRARLDAARGALSNAKDHPGPDDVQRVGTKSGFTREVPTQEYEAKLAKLEEDVKKAEEDLRRAGGKP
ncbi:MAG TPA: DUF4124 domain-containing protein [Usitatibacter sp.]|nr:DUF4124 domain-containing protein [Usitatibacter sp.]